MFWTNSSTQCERWNHTASWHRVAEVLTITSVHVWCFVIVKHILDGFNSVFLPQVPTRKSHQNTESHYKGHSRPTVICCVHLHHARCKVRGHRQDRMRWIPLKCLIYSALTKVRPHCYLWPTVMFNVFLWQNIWPWDFQVSHLKNNFNYLKKVCFYYFF